MRRRFNFVIVLVALVLAAQPLLHNHPLDGGGDTATASTLSICAVCATGIGPLPSTTPTVSASQVILYTIAQEPVGFFSAIAPLTRDSRGPPVV